MKLPLLDSLIHYFGQTWWAPMIVRGISPFLRQREKVLDIGAGGGWVGELIQRKNGSKITLLDVADFNRTNLPLVLYDGITMPFQKESFDTALLIFVLHHCRDPLSVLGEAVRVARRRIIIFEDTFVSPAGKFLACVNDFFSNLHFFIANPFKMNMPFHYKKVSDWEKIFQSLSLKVSFKKITNHAITKHVLFVLDK